MNEFRAEYEKIKSYYNSDNPFKALIAQKENFADCPLILYGFGILCHTIISVCKDFDIRITAVCDTNKAGPDPETGLEIISPERLQQEYPKANIVICSYRYADEIKQKLISLGFPESRIYQSTFSMTSFIHPSDFERDHLGGYEWAYNFFTDDVSKKLILDRIRMYITGQELSKTSDSPTYFEKGIIKLGPNEVFVDGGAYTGDTAEAFIEQIQTKGLGDYRHIYSFEPDSAAYEEAVRNLSRYDGVDVVAKGLWSCDAELEFFSDGGNASSTFVTGNRTIIVPVTSIDSSFAGKPYEELPTFIKMDIEGAEKEALIGAEGIIREKHPKLAICVYHKPEDIYELPKLIHDMDQSYQFTLRQCAEGLYDTVLYAV